MTSPKEAHPRYAVGLFSRVCPTRTPRRMYRCEQEKACQTLKITPRPLNVIDVVLKRMPVTERLSLFFVPDLPGWSFQGVTAVGCLPPPLFPSVPLGARGSPTRNSLK